MFKAVHVLSFLGLLPLAACAAATPSETTGSTAAAIRDSDTPPLDRWAALAFGVEWLNPATGVGNNHIGRAVSEATEFSAKDAAIGACGFSTCETKVYVNVGCVGMAHGFESTAAPREWYGWGATRYDEVEGATVSEKKRNTRALAGETAIEGCGGGTLNRFCTVQEVYCTWDTEDVDTAATIRAWVNMMGGERDPGVLATLHYLSRAAEPLLRNSGLTYEQARCVVSGHWARVEQVATSCRISTDQLDTVYSFANP